MAKVSTRAQIKIWLISIKCKCIENHCIKWSDWKVLISMMLWLQVSIILYQKSWKYFANANRAIHHVFLEWWSRKSMNGPHALRRMKKVHGRVCIWHSRAIYSLNRHEIQKIISQKTFKWTDIVCMYILLSTTITFCWLVHE